MIINRPPMGWNSWNTFAENINEKVVMETADFIVESGLKDSRTAVTNTLSLMIAGV